MDAALTILVRDGYESVSIESIAHEAGVTRPVVYGVFTDLRDLLGALLDRQQARALSQLADILPGELDLSDLDRLVATTARRLIEAVKADPMTWQPILATPQGMPEQVRARIDADRDNLITQIAGLLDVGLAGRGVRNLDAEVLAHAIVAILEHFGRILFTDPERFDTDRLVAAVTSVLKVLQ